MQIVGLDIGGANLKAATADGGAASVSFPLWQRPDELAAALESLISRFDAPDLLAVTMTGELADCYATKAEGVARILQSVQQAAHGAEVQVWQTAGEFVEPQDAVDEPLLTAAANWHALATWLGRLQPDGFALLLDIGTTTTDVIPIFDGLPATEGTTDVGRLLAGELVYTGVRRTPLCAVAPQAPFRGELCPMAAELFATTHDVYLLTGEVAEEPNETSTANGQAATQAAAHDRIARQLCCDATELDQEEAVVIARALRTAQIRQIATAVERVVSRQPSQCRQMILSGSGTFLAEAVQQSMPALRQVPVQRLDQILSVSVAESACAFALARLAEERRLVP